MSLLKNQDGDFILDVKGYQCPLPVLKAQKAFRSLESGDKLRIFATDEGAWDDFQHFANEQNYILHMREKKQDYLVFLIEKI